MRRPTLALLLVLPALALGACGRGEKIDTAKYTCTQFNKSLRTKSDTSAGQFINRLRDKAKLGQAKDAERREVTLGIFFTCRGKPGSTRPADKAVVIAKQIRDGKFKVPAQAQPKKKSTK
jgi:hypothetical protein